MNLWKDRRVDCLQMCIRDSPAPAEPVSYAAGSADDFAVIDDNEDLPF